MKRYMVIESIRENCLDAVYARLHAKGRMLPAGLEYIDSWLERDGGRCFQLMHTEGFELFARWTTNWDDPVSFEIAELGEKPAAV